MFDEHFFNINILITFAAEGDAVCLARRVYFSLRHVHENRQQEHGLK